MGSGVLNLTSGCGCGPAPHITTAAAPQDSLEMTPMPT